MSLNVVLLINRETAEVHSVYRLGYVLDGRGIGVLFLVGANIILLTTVFRLILRPTQPPEKWVSRALCAELQRPVLEADISFPSSAQIKNAWCHNSTTFMYV
jgi:hypothetical protein